MDQDTVNATLLEVVDESGWVLGALVVPVGTRASLRSSVVTVRLPSLPAASEAEQVFLPGPEG